MAWDKDAGEELLLRLLERYGEHYTIHREVTVGDTRLPAMAQYHLVADRTIFGIPSERLKAKGNEANEYLLFSLEDTFNEACAEKAINLCDAAEKTFLRLHDTHGHSFFSLVVLARTVEPGAVKRLRRHRRFTDYQYGWGMVRIAVWEEATGKLHCNRDGKDLGRLVKARLEGRPEPQ